MKYKGWLIKVFKLPNDNLWTYTRRTKQGEVLTYNALPTKAGAIRLAKIQINRDIKRNKDK